MKVDKYLQAHPRGYHPFAEIETWKEDTIANQMNGNLRDGEGESQDMDMEDVEKLNAFPSPPPPGFGDPLTFDDTLINQLLVSFKGSGTRRASGVVRLTVRSLFGKYSWTLMNFQDLAFQSPELVMDQVKELVAAIGVNHMAFAAEEDSGRLKDKGVLYFG